MCWACKASQPMKQERASASLFKTEANKTSKKQKRERSHLSAVPILCILSICSLCLLVSHLGEPTYRRGKRKLSCERS